MYGAAPSRPPSSRLPSGSADRSDPGVVSCSLGNDIRRRRRAGESESTIRSNAERLRSGEGTRTPKEQPLPETLRPTNRSDEATLESRWETSHLTDGESSGT